MSPLPRTLGAMSVALAIASVGSKARGQELRPLPPPNSDFAQPPPGPPPGPPPPPSSSVPPPPPAERAQEVRFQPDEPGLTLLGRSGTMPVTRISASPYFLWFEHGLVPLYSPICPGPCTTRMLSGDYQLALAKDGGRAVAVLAPVAIRRPSVIHGHYVDRSGTRAGGIALALGGTAAGIVMIALSASREDVCDASGYCFRRTVFDPPLAAGGVGVLLGSIIIGSVLVAQHDEAHVLVTPLVAWNRPERTAIATSIGPTLQGAALTFRF